MNWNSWKQVWSEIFVLWDHFFRTLHLIRSFVTVNKSLKNKSPRKFEFQRNSERFKLKNLTPTNDPHNFNVPNICMHAHTTPLFFLSSSQRTSSLNECYFFNGSVKATFIAFFSIKFHSIARRKIRSEKWKKKTAKWFNRWIRPKFGEKVCDNR